MPERELHDSEQCIKCIWQTFQEKAHHMAVVTNQSNWGPPSPGTCCSPNRCCALQVSQLDSMPKPAKFRSKVSELHSTSSTRRHNGNAAHLWPCQRLLLLLRHIWMFLASCFAGICNMGAHVTEPISQRLEGLQAPDAHTLWLSRERSCSEA